MIFWWGDIARNGYEEGQRQAAAGYGWLAIPVGVVLALVLAACVYAVINRPPDK